LEDLKSKIVRVRRRRSIALVITKDAKLEVRAPLKASLKSIEEFVNENRSWVEKKIREKRAFIDKYRRYIFPEDFVDGAQVTYEGKTYQLQISDCQDIIVSDLLQFPKKFLPHAEQYLIIWLKHQALKKTTERTKFFANITDLKYKSIKITSAESIWGSCGPNNSLIVNGG